MLLEKWKVHKRLLRGKRQKMRGMRWGMPCRSIDKKTEGWIQCKKVHFMRGLRLGVQARRDFFKIKQKK